jgi:MFS family permease
MTDATAPPAYSNAYRGTVLALLLSAYTFSFIDRTIVNTIGQAIKLDLKLTDTQLGVLNGLAFAILYSILQVPVARLAERVNRVRVIGAALILWSGFTAACGFAGSYTTLLFTRIGVGIGEAGCSPPSHALISDYFPPERRASALGVYAFGIPLGGMIGAMAGGWLAQAFNWRLAFMVVGLPGVILALAIMLLIKEPRRDRDFQPPPWNVARELRELWAVTVVLFARWPVLNIMLGMTIVSFAGYGGGAFAAPYFIRTFGLDYATVGLFTGLAGGIAAGAGTLIGGVLTDWAAKHSPRWYALTPAIGLTLSLPFIYLVYTVSTWQMAVAFLLLPGIFSYTYLAPSFSIVQNSAPPESRATAAAVFLLFVNIIALGGGPVFTGALIDALSRYHLNHPHMTDMWTAATNAFSDTGPLDFKHLCPGGKAGPGAPAELGAACHAAIVTATRQGQIITYAIGLWGAFHYFLGSFGLTRDLIGTKA